MEEEEVLELREEAKEYMLETAEVSEAYDADGDGGTSVEDEYGGLKEFDPNVPSESGTQRNVRTYPCRVTMPTSHNVLQEYPTDNLSSTVTKILIVFPGDAVVKHISRIKVNFRDGRIMTFEATQVEPHSDQITLHVYATKLGI